jgi:hypothetical protein
VGQKHHPERAVVFPSAQLKRRLAGKRRPVTADQVCNRQQRTPIVGGAVVQRVRNLGLGIDKPAAIIISPPSGLLTQALKLSRVPLA